MRFVCDSCRAQYMISDDKVGANGVKVRCKKCGNVIVVRPPQEAVDAEAALRGLEESAPQPPVPEGPTGENSIFSDVDDAEIGAAFESALGERPDEPPPQETEQPPVEANLPPVSDGPPRALDWYVAIDEKQTGPLTPEAIKEYWDRGEIGPDSLTWRQGFEDWVALSEVAELAGWLAPRPQRPVFSPASSPSSPVPVVPVPVESAFAAGGVMRTVRAEVPTPVPDSGGWKPSASAALASLVKEEIDALSKPDAPPPAPEPVAAPRSLLEVPPATGEVPAAQVNGRSARTEARTPVTGVDRPPTFTPAYPYATTRPARAGNRNLLIGIGAGVAVVLVVVAGVGWTLLQRQKAAELVARQTPPPDETPKVTPSPAEPAKVVQAQPPAPTGPAASPGVTPPVTPPVAKVTPVTPSVLPTESGGTRRGTRGSRSHGGSKSGGGDEVASADPPARSSGNKNKADDLFDEVFGTGGGSAKSEESRGKKSAYVPPAPGSSNTEVPERLPKGDIMSVVLANKPSILRCANEQKARDPNLHGTLVMHWVIQTSGKTGSVNPVTDQFKSSYMATCLSGLVKSWNFPKHRYQPGEPVDFPFTF